MVAFEQIASVYDSIIANGRFNYEGVIDTLRAYGVINPKTIADLASGTGNMVLVLTKHWPDAAYVCEEPSQAMNEEFKKKLPTIPITQKRLQETDVREQDLITVVFNSLNYVPPQELSDVCKRLSRGLRMLGTLYVDVLTRESALELLGGKSVLLKVQRLKAIEIQKRLTAKKLTHVFKGVDGCLEKHIQYLLPEHTYRSCLESAGLQVLDVLRVKGTMRTEIVCKKLW